MITLEHYFGRFIDDATDEQWSNAQALLERVNPLLEAAAADGVTVSINPTTRTCVSGEQYGGFRPQSCRIGAPRSKHKMGQAIDVYDPHNELDRWLTDERLVKFGLYREHPDDTPRWCHLSNVAPGSGRRTFKP